MNNFLIKIIFILFFSLKTSFVFSHEMWIEPESFVLRANEKLNAHIRVGQNFNGNSYPYISSETKSLKLFNKQKQIFIKNRDGDYPAIQLILRKNDLYILSYESIPEKVDYENFDKFKLFLQEQNLWNKWSKDNPNLINSKINEIYTRYAKSLIQVGNSDGNDFNTGLKFELIALNNPYNKSQKLEVLLIYNNKPFKNSLITIFNKFDNKIEINKIMTNQFGKATISLNKKGIYLLNAVQFIKNNTPSADWQSLWASLTFEKK